MKGFIYNSRFAQLLQKKNLRIYHEIIFTKMEAVGGGGAGGRFQTLNFKLAVSWNGSFGHYFVEIGHYFVEKNPSETVLHANISFEK